MLQAKQLALLERLKFRTESGRLSWEKTVEADVFQTVLGEYTILITGEEAGFRISIFDANGDLVDRFGPRDVLDVTFDPHGLFRDVHNLARIQAMGVNEALDDILGELDDHDDDDDKGEIVSF